MKAWYKKNKVGLKLAKAWLGLAVAVLAIFLVQLLILAPLLVGFALFIIFTALAIDTINLKE